MRFPALVEEWKQQAAERALSYLEDGMLVGLGTGSTAAKFVDLVGERVKHGLSVTCVPTSEATRLQAERLGIELTTLDDVPFLDLTVDGADELDNDLRLIKGGGGALLREKIVASASHRMIVIADGSKLVVRLGKFPLPVEVTEFGHAVTLKRLEECLGDLGYSHIGIALRMADALPFRTDGGNVIYDCKLAAIHNARDLACALKSITGVVEHGLFIDLATTLVVAHTVDDIDIIERKS